MCDLTKSGRLIFHNSLTSFLHQPYLEIGGEKENDFGALKSHFQTRTKSYLFSDEKQSREVVIWLLIVVETNTRNKLNLI